MQKCSKQVHCRLRHNVTASRGTVTYTLANVHAAIAQKGNQYNPIFFSVRGPYQNQSGVTIYNSSMSTTIALLEMTTQPYINFSAQEDLLL